MKPPVYWERADSSGRHASGGRKILTSFPKSPNVNSDMCRMTRRLREGDEEIDFADRERRMLGDLQEN